MIPGNGYRLANDVLIEISLHLVQPFVYTATVGSVSSGLQTVALVSLGIPINACYIGASLLVIDSVNGNEVIILTAVDTSTNQVTANFVFSHPPGVTVSGATWPLQVSTDAVFTQGEGLAYLSRAQNEFLSQCPLIYTQSQQQAMINLIFQSAPANMIEMERVSFSTVSWSEAGLIRDLNVVTATFPYDVSIYTGQDITVYKCTGDQSFLGCFKVSSGATPGGDPVTTLTWPQDGEASGATAGILCVFNRLYEITQQEQTMQERTWRNDTFLPPLAWFEDRAGNYQWGLNARPQGNFPMNLWYSIRDNDALTLADGFVTPDAFLPYVKYKAMEYFYSKDGVWNSPKMALYCKSRFDRGVMIVNRFFEGEQMGLEKKNG